QEDVDHGLVAQAGAPARASARGRPARRLGPEQVGEVQHGPPHRVRSDPEAPTAAHPVAEPPHPRPRGRQHVLDPLSNPTPPAAIGTTARRGGTVPRLVRHQFNNCPPPSHPPNPRVPPEFEPGGRGEYGRWQMTDDRSTGLSDRGWPMADGRWPMADDRSTGLS